jgi:kumamolisin
LRLIEIDGAKNTLGGAADTENALDGLQMQSIAPKADISMILGPNNIQGMADVYERAIFPRAGEAQNSVVSTSWGLAENNNGTQLLNVLGTTFRQAALRGVSVFAGAGDNGARSHLNTYQPEYPAADPNVTGVGGLKMRLNEDGSLAHVQVWDEGENSSTGGGISKIFSVPYWQKKLGMVNNVDTNLPGRGVPDISTNGAKSTGYPVRVGGENLVIGGTSAGAPLYGGLMLNINAELAAQGIKPVSPLNPWMYARASDPNIFHDVLKGGNHGYNAGPGWDAASGLGWVDGTAMLNAMKENQTARLPTTFSLFPQGLNITQPLQQSSDHK